MEASSRIRDFISIDWTINLAITLTITMAVRPVWILLNWSRFPASPHWPRPLLNSDHLHTIVPKQLSSLLCDLINARLVCHSHDYIKRFLSNDPSSPCLEVYCTIALDVSLPFPAIFSSLFLTSITHPALFIMPVPHTLPSPAAHSSPHLTSAQCYNSGCG